MKGGETSTPLCACRVSRVLTRVFEHGPGFFRREGVTAATKITVDVDRPPIPEEPLDLFTTQDMKDARHLLLRTSAHERHGTPRHQPYLFLVEEAMKHVFRRQTEKLVLRDARGECSNPIPQIGIALFLRGLAANAG